jgi:pilus assembly protein CpaB
VLTRRVLILVIAAVVAAVAAGSTWLYISGADNRAYANAQLVHVFRVKQAVAKGLPGEQAIVKGLIVAGEMPTKFRPEAAINSLDEIRGKVALTALSPGQVVVAGQFVDSKMTTSAFSQRIPTGQVAISVQVDQVRGVSNLVGPGDKVNLLVTTPDSERTLLQNIDVLAVGASAAPSADPQAAAANAGSGLITFAVPLAAAQKIAYASAERELTRLYLTLVPADNKPVNVPPANKDNIFQGGLTPYAP